MKYAILIFPFLVGCAPLIKVLETKCQPPPGECKVQTTTIYQW